MTNISVKVWEENKHEFDTKAGHAIFDTLIEIINIQGFESVCIIILSLALNSLLIILVFVS